jgi:pimeloyl-ACP methyl ester carboxylesterase
MQVKMVLRGAKLGPRVNGKKMPLMILSHGIGGTMNMYSSFCSEMASLGIAVAAVEHQDSSAAMTITIGGESIEYQHSTAPLLGKDRGYTWRHSQQEQRVQEVMQVHTAMKHSKKFKEDIDFKSCVIAGHSFGGATALAAATSRPDLFPCMLAIDAWLWPLVNDDMDLLRITRDFAQGSQDCFKGSQDCFKSIRMLFIDSMEYASDERWWAPKVAICKAAAEPSTFVRIDHASHHVSSDVPILAGTSAQLLCAYHPGYTIQFAVLSVFITFYNC